MSQDNRLACNRLPFQTDSSCDRGGVDIHVFDEFPICTPIDPTPPESAVPQTDAAVIPITPPPCSCVNVDMRGTGNVESRKDVSVSGDFRAIGDCCDGNYEAKINVDIPCIPFSISGGTTSRKISVQQKCGLDFPSGTFNPGITIRGCNVSVSPSMSLELPKPKDVDIQPSIVMTHNCGVRAEGEFGVSVVRRDCEVIFKPKLRLNIPPIPHLDVCPEGTVNIAEGGIGAKGRLDMGTSTDACGNTNRICPTLDLDIPCPINVSEVKIRTLAGWKEDPQESEIIILKNEEPCMLHGLGGDVDLTLPCPVKLTESRIKASIGWKNKPESEEIVVVKKSEEDCGIEGEGGVLDFGLPCPVDMNPLGINFEIETGKKASVTHHVDLLSSHNCKLYPETPTVKIVIPEQGGGGGGSGTDVILNTGTTCLFDEENKDKFLLSEKKTSGNKQEFNLQFNRCALDKIISVAACSGKESDIMAQGDTLHLESMPNSNVIFSIRRDGVFGNFKISIGAYYV